MNEALRKFLQNNGAKGGQSRSPAKVAAARINARKARQSLADRSPVVRKLEDAGKIKRVDEQKASVDSTVVYDPDAADPAWQDEGPF